MRVSRRARATPTRWAEGLIVRARGLSRSRAPLARLAMNCGTWIGTGVHLTGPETAREPQLARWHGACFRIAQEPSHANQHGAGSFRTRKTREELASRISRSDFRGRLVDGSHLRDRLRGGLAVPPDLRLRASRPDPRGCGRDRAACHLRAHGHCFRHHRP